MGERESSAVAFGASKKHKIIQAIDIDEGMKQIPYYEKMGWIQFPEKKMVVEKDVVEYTDVRQLSEYQKIALSIRAKNQLERNPSRTAKSIAGELGLNESTLGKWLVKYAGHKPVDKREGYKEKFEHLKKLINEEHWPLTEAAKKAGIKLSSASRTIERRGYVYDKKLRELVKA